MKLNRIDHIGIVVDNIEEATALLGQGFGLEAGPTVQREDLCTAFFKCGDVSLEVIEIKDPEMRQARLGNSSERGSSTSPSKLTIWMRRCVRYRHLECNRKLHRVCLVADSPFGQKRTVATA